MFTNPDRTFLGHRDHTLIELYSHLTNQGKQKYKELNVMIWKISDYKHSKMAPSFFISLSLLLQIYFSFSFFLFLEHNNLAWVATSPALTFSHSKVFTQQLPMDALHLVEAGTPGKKKRKENNKQQQHRRLLTKETHCNPGRREAEECRHRPHISEKGNRVWLKSKQNKPYRKHKHSAHFARGACVKKLMCRLPAWSWGGGKILFFYKRLAF